MNGMFGPGMPSHAMLGKNGLVGGRQMSMPAFPASQGIMSMGQPIMSAAPTMMFPPRHMKQAVNKRRGKWTNEEEEYANKLIEAFKTGSIQDCEDGCTLRSFLATKLQCAPMRISKKFAGTSVGKLIYIKSDAKGADVDAANAALNVQLRDLHELFITSITSPSPTAGDGKETAEEQAAAAAQQKKQEQHNRMVNMLNMQTMQNMQGMQGIQGMGMPGGHMPVPHMSVPGLGMNYNMYDPAAMKQMMANMAQANMVQMQQQQMGAMGAHPPRRTGSSSTTTPPVEAVAAATEEPLRSMGMAAVQDDTAGMTELKQDGLDRIEDVNFEKTFEDDDDAAEDVEEPVATTTTSAAAATAAAVAVVGEDVVQLGRGLKRALGSMQTMPQRKRRFKAWSKPEELYTEALVDAFQKGVLKDCFRSCTLQAYLATKLHCSPRRIAVKFRTTRLNPARIIYSPTEMDVPKATLAMLNRRLAQFQVVFQTNLVAREHELDDDEEDEADDNENDELDFYEDNEEEDEDEDEEDAEQQPVAKAARREQEEGVSSASSSSAAAAAAAAASASSALASASAAAAASAGSQWATSTPGIWVPFNHAMSMLQEGSTADASATAEESAPVFTTKDYANLMDIARSQIAWSVTNELGAFVDCNDIFARVAGFTREEVSRKTIFDLTLTRDMQKNMGVLSEMMSQDPTDMPAQFLLRGISGERKPLLIILQLMRDESGANAGISCCVLPQDSTFPVLQNMQQKAQVEEEQDEEQPEQQQQQQQQQIPAKTENTEEEEDLTADGTSLEV
jgi:PAS domain S-box-containing protein